MRGPDKTGGQIWGGRLRGIDLRPPVAVLALLVGATNLGRAQPDDPGPEQPAWNDSSPDHATSAAQKITTPRPEGVGTGIPSPGVETDSVARPTATTEFGPATVDPSAGTVDSAGVPAAQRQFLPSFDYYDRPLFERDGLKFRAGPVNLRIELSMSEEYNDNIFASPVNPVTDLITRITPKFLFGVGDFQAQTEDYLSFQYLPQFQYFLENSDQSRVNQELHVSGKATFSRYSTDVRLDYVNNNEPNATQSGRQSYQITTFTWNNVYYLGAKTFASAAVGVTNQNYESGQNYTTYSLSPQIGYAFSPKTTIFAGPYVGLVDVGQGATQTFQGLTVGFSYDTMRKLKLDGSLGVQARQFHGETFAGAQDFTTPIFNLSATWTPTQLLTFELALARSVEVTDIVRGLTYTTTSIALNGGWQILRNLSFKFGAGLQYLDYQGDVSGNTEEHTETYISAGPTLTYTFWRDQIGVDFYYLRQQRTSEIAGTGYAINTCGLRFNYKF